MLEAAWWGFVGGAALLLGALVGVLWTVPVRVLGLILGFGAGVLFNAVSYELTFEAFQTSGTVPLVVGMLAGDPRRVRGPRASQRQRRGKVECARACAVPHFRP